MRIPRSVLVSLAALSLFAIGCGDSSSSKTGAAVSTAGQSTPATGASSTTSSQTTGTESTPGVATKSSKQDKAGGLVRVCTVSGVRNVAPSTVAATIQVPAQLANARGLADCAGAAAVVKPIALTRAQKPTRLGPFNCVPSVKGKNTAFVCTATVGKSGTATYSFTLRYKG